MLKLIPTRSHLLKIKVVIFTVYKYILLNKWCIRIFLLQLLWQISTLHDHGSLKIIFWAISFNQEIVRNKAKGRILKQRYMKVKHANFSKNLYFLPPNTPKFVFPKIWRALPSCYLRFEIRPFALLPMKYKYRWV